MKFDFKAMDKKTAVRLGVMFVAGILLLILSGILGGVKPRETADRQTASFTAAETVLSDISSQSALSAESYEERLEKKLEETLSYVYGAGKVKALVTVSYGKEKILATSEKNEFSQLTEDDGGGGTRESMTQKTESQTILVKQKDGGESPLILKEIEPKIEGVVIIAEGGGDITVKDALTRAVQAAYNVEAHKISILKMK